MSKKMKNKTIVVAPAIKTKFWQKLYYKFLQSNVPFHFVFVGHIRPSFSLPDNFTYIWCEEKAATCAEVAYQYAHSEIKEAKYIINIADDLEFPEMFLDGLISLYEEKALQLQNEFLCVGPTLLTHTYKQSLMAINDGGPVVLGPMLTTIENSKKIGGVDKNFTSVYWDCDRQLRAVEAGGYIYCAQPKEVFPLREIEYFANDGLWYNHGAQDRKLLDALWSFRDDVCGLINCSSFRKKADSFLNENVYFNKKIVAYRKMKVIEYNKKQIERFYEKK